MEFESNLIKKYNIKFDITLWTPENIVWLNNLVIPEKFCHKGIGSKLLTAFTTWLDENKYSSKLLVSDCYGTPINDLIQFYGKFGYTDIETRRKNIYLIRKYNDGNN